MNTTLSTYLSLVRILSVLAALGLVLAGPAYSKIPASNPQLDLSEFTLPDGTLPIICFGNGAPVTSQTPHCHDCLTGKLVSALPGSTSVSIRYALSILNTTVSVVRIGGSGFGQNHPTRAPPVS